MAEQLNIIPIKLDVEFPNEALGMYLCQIDVQLNPNTKRLQNPLLAWNNIENLFQFILSCEEGQSFNFVILPEISVPVQYLDNLHASFKDKFPSNSILLAGLELIQTNQYQAIAKSLNIDTSGENSPFSDLADSRPLNLCIIAVKDKLGKSSFYLQPKLTHSKYQGSLDTVESLLPCNLLYYFSTNQLNFITLICSDLFNRRIGSLRKIVDEISHDIIEEDKGLDFLFNIQYNPAPDNFRFLNSLNRLYDDGYLARSNLCTIFLNAVLDGDRLGGKSKVIFHHNHNITSAPFVKRLDAPIKGYEVSDENPAVLFFQFDRLPRLWDSDRDQSPIHSKLYKQRDSTWEPQNTSHLTFLSPINKSHVLDSSSYEDLAKIESQHGNYSKAIHWAEKALAYWEKQREYYKAAQAALLAAQQYRHQGHFNDALRLYAHAEHNIRKYPLTSPEDRLTGWRITTGRLMVEAYLLDCDTKHYSKELKAFERNLQKYLDSSPNLTQPQHNIIDLYLIHSIRQRAETQRLMGYYDRAYKLFHKTEKRYKYVFPREKAYSILGQAEALRMIGKFDGSMEFFDIAKEYANIYNDRRLLFRIQRGIAEVSICKNGHIPDKVALELKMLAHEDNYLFGRLYYLLVMGEHYLAQKQFDTARQCFNEALDLSKNDNRICKIEYTHALFGSAETDRLNNKTECVEKYRVAFENYTSMNIGWGIFRTGICLQITSNDRTPTNDKLNALCKKEWQYDSEIYRAFQNKIEIDRTLFTNLI